MTTARDATRSTSVLTTALLLSLCTGVVSAVVSAMVSGLDGLYASLIGVALVVAFFGMGHVVLTRLRGIEPSMFLVIAMLTYVLQIACLLAVFGSFASWSGAVSATAMGVTIIVCTVAWTVGLVISSRRQRIPLFDLGGEGR